MRSENAAVYEGSGYFAVIPVDSHRHVSCREITLFSQTILAGFSLRVKYTHYN
jgi:hypothetical protein